MKTMKDIFLFILLATTTSFWSFSQSLNDSLIVHYPLDGNANDVGLNNLDGSYFASSASDCAGNPTAATYFDGIDDYISFPDDSLLKPQMPVSFYFRIKFLAYPQPKLFFCSEFNYTNYYGFWLNITQTGYLHASYGDGGTQDISNRRTANATSKLDLNKWYDITIVINGPTNIVFYINCDTENAVFTGSGGPLAYSTNDSTGGLGRFGRPPAYFDYFNGYLDEFRMWNRALTAQDVELLHNSPCILSNSVSATICQGDSFSINNTIYHDTTGIYTDTIYNATSLGCDSIISLDLTVLPASSAILNKEICQGENFNFNGEILIASGTYFDTLSAYNSCDSLVTLFLNVLPVYDTLLQVNICQGDTFNFNGRKLTVSGIFSDTLPTVNFCDSIVTLDLTVMPIAVTPLNIKICGGSYYFFNGTNLNQNGSYKDTLQSSNSCDSIVTLNLTVIPTKYETFNLNICEGDTFDFNGDSITLPGIYRDTVLSSSQCDSIITLNVSVLQKSSTTLNQEICSGQSFNFNGNNLTVSGTYLDTFPAANSCDSIVTLNLNVKPISFTPLQEDICEGDTFNFNGKDITISGLYSDTLLAANFCDSIVTLDLTVHSKVYTFFTHDICQSSSYFFGGKNLVNSGTYIDTLQSSNSCDSIVTLDLTVHPIKSDTLNPTICEGDTFDFHGTPLTTTGTYKDTLLSSASCDSIITVNLSVLQKSSTILNEKICSGESFNFNGKNLTVSGIYRDTLSAANSCDSIIILNLEVKPRSFTQFQEFICQGDAFEFGNNRLTNTGTYYDTLIAANLCDSIVVLDLTVRPSIFTSLTDSIFSNGSYHFNGKVISKAGVYHDTLAASNGCDSIITLNLSIKYPRGTLIVNICPGDTVEVNDSAYFMTGIYIDTLYGTASNGADSMLYIMIEDQLIEICYPLSLDIPNVFTPNNDGLHDEFLVKGKNIASYEIKVYSRWGQLVYFSTDFNQTWDGRFNGNNCMDGIYFYTVECTGMNGEVLSKKGPLTIIR